MQSKLLLFLANIILLCFIAMGFLGLAKLAAAMWFSVMGYPH